MVIMVVINIQSISRYCFTKQNILLCDQNHHITQIKVEKIWFFRIIIDVNYWL